MWQNEQEALDLLDIITIISLGLQIRNDSITGKLQDQLNRIEQKLDILIRRNNYE